jgi:hypothetical protein
MDHPNSYHRLGAAMAVHRMYPVLRENGAIVDRYIFEILFFCIKSLKLGELDDEQIGIRAYPEARKFDIRTIFIVRCSFHLEFGGTSMLSILWTICLLSSLPVSIFEVDDIHDEIVPFLFFQVL